MITIILGLKMIRFALDHLPEGVALIRKLASYSANHFAFGIIFIFLIKMPAEKSVFNSFTLTLAQPIERN